MIRLLLISTLVLSSSLALGTKTSCFASLDKAFSEQKDFAEIENMPRIRSQDSFEICFGCSSATIAQHYYCKEKHIKCTNLPLKKEFSPFAMAGLANISEVAAANAEYKLKFGGPGANALNNIINNPHASSESCYPFDQVANKYGLNNGPAVENVLKKIKDQYEKQKTEGGICVECLKQTIQDGLGSSIALENLRTYLKDEDFDHFLYDVIIYGNNCADTVRLDPSPNKLGFFPKEKQTVQPSEIIAKAKELLKKGFPINVDGLCPYHENGKCLGYHALVLAGYKKLCTASGECRDVLKVHNSWGEDWQKRHDDGWVDAETLLGGKTWGTAALSWLE